MLLWGSEHKQDVIRYCLMKIPPVASVEDGCQEGMRGEAGRPVRKPVQLSRGEMMRPGPGQSCATPLKISGGKSIPDGGKKPKVSDTKIFQYEVF